mgnify:FL=1|jgi:hypothetical protein|tara:strand:+ start:403 stop:708 length:306 start_codon:yes stop_codon:yes gene_type:complete
MANTYKRVISTLTSTGDNSVYTCPTATTTLIKAVKVFNDTSGAAQISMKVNAIEVEREASLASKAAKSFVSSTDVLEAADVLKINTNVQPVNVYVTFLEIS